jgi:aldose 1-epimerase
MTENVIAGTEQRSSRSSRQVPSITAERFGTTADQKRVTIYTLTNGRGIRARVMTYGATLVSLETPDRDGRFGDVTLGFDALAGYLGDHPLFGSTVGRFANRIAKGSFTLDGVEYTLVKNDGENHLHGGSIGFDKVIWEAESLQTDDAAGVRFSYFSKDWEEGYPGNLACSVTYSVTNDDELIIEYLATTDKPTIINLTHHSYFNLAGQGNGDVLGHQLMIDADRYTPTDEGFIPTGELRRVDNSPFDFRQSRTIGGRIAQVQGGYNHNYVLNAGGGSLSLAARVYEPGSGRLMEILTTEPGIQFYPGNFLDGSITGKAGKVYRQYYGLCLEAQHFPDSPNKPLFPSVVLRPGEQYTQRTVHRFSASWETVDEKKGFRSWGPTRT